MRNYTEERTGHEAGNGEDDDDECDDDVARIADGETIEENHGEDEIHDST